VPVGEELGAGNIIHKVIQRLSKGEDKSKLDVILDEEVYLPLAEYSHEQHTKKSIKEKIEFLIQSGILQKIDKSEYKFEIPLENVIVTGIIDATRKLPNNSIEVIDWKYSIHEELFPRYEKQLRFYAYILEKLGMDVTRALLYDLNASSKIDHLQSINIDISLASIKQVITKANKSIMNLSNNDPITEPHPICCAICDVAFICPDRIIAK
jgi:CRISPR/Cas system-associated exonuclease Cas4 (RecB family)